MANGTNDQEPGDGFGELVPGPEQFRHGGLNDEQPALLGVGHSYRPGIAVPRTVLVCDLGDGALYLAGWRKGLGAYLTPEDAVPLRRELAAAFGSEDKPSERFESWPYG
jgi:hypothetical protein